MEDAGLFGSVVGNGDFVGMTYALKTIGAFAKEGWSNVLPELQALINGVVRLSLIMTFMVWLFKPSPDVISEFLWVVIKLNFVLWVMNNFWDITQKIFDGMIGMGLAAAPDAVKGLADTAAMKDPGRVANLGTIAVTPLIKHIDSMLGPIDIFWYATELLFAYAALITAISVFLVFGLLIFLATVEFYIVAIPAGCMAPFIAWNKSAFIATPAIAYVFNSGIRLLGTTVVVMMGLSIMLAYKWPTEPTIQDSINILILTIAIFGAALSVFKKLSGLINGGPVADVGGALGAMWYAARLGSAAGKEISEVGAGLSSGRGPLPKAMGGFINGVRGNGNPSGGNPGTPSGSSGGGAANANGPGGLRGTFQQGITNARAVASSFKQGVAIGYQGGGTAGIGASFKQGFASGYGSTTPGNIVSPGGPSPVNASGQSSKQPTQNAQPSQQPPARLQATPRQAAAARSGAAGQSKAGGSSPPQEQAAPAASNGSVGGGQSSDLVQQSPAGSAAHPQVTPSADDLPPPPEWASVSNDAGESAVAASSDGGASGRTVLDASDQPAPPVPTETASGDGSGVNAPSGHSSSSSTAIAESKPPANLQGASQMPVSNAATPSPAQESRAPSPPPSNVANRAPLGTDITGMSRAQASAAIRKRAMSLPKGTGEGAKPVSLVQRQDARALGTDVNGMTRSQAAAAITAHKNWYNQGVANAKWQPQSNAHPYASDSRPIPAHMMPKTSQASSRTEALATSSPSSPVQPTSASASPREPNRFQIREASERAAEKVADRYHNISSGAKPDPNANAPYTTDWKERRPQEAKEVAERLARLKAGTWK